jgi:hypothetical protein
LTHSGLEPARPSLAIRGRRVFAGSRRRDAADGAAGLSNPRVAARSVLDDIAREELGEPSIDPRSSLHGEADAVRPASRTNSL